MKVQKIIATIVAIAISSAGFAKEIATRPNAVQASKSFNSKVFDVDNSRKIQAVELSKQEMQETEGEFLLLVAIGLGAIAFGMWVKHGENYAKTGEPASIKEVTKAGAIDGATAVMPGGSAIGTVKKVKTVATVSKAVSNTKKTTNVVNNTKKLATTTTNTVKTTTKPKGDPILAALKDAKPLGNRPNQVATDLNDGTKVVFRKDFRDQAHTLSGPFTGKGDINHYNIEIRPAKRFGASKKPIEDFHIVPQKNGDLLLFNKNMKQIHLKNKK